MKDFKGTPGPWIVEDGDYVMDQDGNCVGAFGGMPATDKDKANANLCAAAPELLESLQNLVEHSRTIGCNEHDYPTEHPMGIAYAAIKKALGQ